MASCKRCDSNIRKHNEVPDGELADAIHQKYHPNVPRAEFDQNLGLTPAAEAPVTLADVGRSAVKDVVNAVKSVATLPQRLFQASDQTDTEPLRITVTEDLAREQPSAAADVPAVGSPPGVADPLAAARGQHQSRKALPMFTPEILLMTSLAMWRMQILRKRLARTMLAASIWIASLGRREVRARYLLSIERLSQFKCRKIIG